MIFSLDTLCTKNPPDFSRGFIFYSPLKDWPRRAKLAEAEAPDKRRLAAPSGRIQEQRYHI